MTNYQILTWHGIPTGVKATDAEGDAIEHLPPRFQAAVDALATKTGLTEYEVYLEGFSYSEPAAREGSAREVAQAVAAEIEAAYPPKRLRHIRQDLETNLGAAANGAGSDQGTQP